VSRKADKKSAKNASVQDVAFVDVLGKHSKKAIKAAAKAKAKSDKSAPAVLAVYEAGQSTRLRKFSRDKASGSLLAKAYAGPLRDQARHLERNHDIARGILRKLVNNTVGPNGITVEPQPRRMIDGSIHEDLAKILADLWRDWSKRPEVTFQYNNAKMQRVAAAAWFRDGEVFAQKLSGPVPTLRHGTRVAFSLELLEADMVPLDVEDGSKVQQGIQYNAWGQPVAYQVYKVHPGETLWQVKSALKTIPAERMIHAKRADRIGQRRGVSEFASVITRLEDVKDYEESERIAAKIAASMAAFIRKGSPDIYEPTPNAAGEIEQRSMRFQPGMVFDDLLPGEEIGTIDTNRPNTNLQAHRDSQLRAVAAGVGASYSAISRNYNGTYSAQRQELVEQWVDYQVLAEEFTSQFVQPVYEEFVAVAAASGLIPRSMMLELETGSLDDALYIGQQMPWIDPGKEADAFILLKDNHFMSSPEIIRRRGGNPTSVLDQEVKWTQMLKDRGLDAHASEPQPVAPAPNKQEKQNNVESE
jgi:lambda family phage portal protein